MQTFANSALMLSAAVLGIAALWHFYWAWGGVGGKALAVPEKSSGGPLFVPSPKATAIVAGCIALIAVLYAAAASCVLENSASANLALGVCGVAFIGRAIGDFRHVGFFKRHSGTPFAEADARYFSPLCLFLGASGLSAAVIHFL